MKLILDYYIYFSQECKLFFEKKVRFRKRLFEAVSCGMNFCYQFVKMHKTPAALGPTPAQKKKKEREKCRIFLCLQRNTALPACFCGRFPTGAGPISRSSPPWIRRSCWPNVSLFAASAAQSGSTLPATSTWNDIPSSPPSWRCSAPGRPSAPPTPASFR